MTTTAPLTFRWGIISTGNIAAAFVKVPLKDPTSSIGVAPILTLIIASGFVGRSKDVSSSNQILFLLIDGSTDEA